MNKRIGVISATLFATAVVTAGCAGPASQGQTGAAANPQNIQLVSNDQPSEDASPNAEIAPPPAIDPAAPPELSDSTFVGEASTLAGLLSESDAVAVVSIAELQGQYDLGPGPMSVFTAQVDSWVVAPSGADADLKQLNLYQAGGVTDEGAEYKVSGDELLEVEGKYVLFLMKNPAGNFNITGGPDGKYKIVDGHVAVSKSQIDDVTARLTVDDFVKKIKSETR